MKSRNNPDTPRLADESVSVREELLNLRLEVARKRRRPTRMISPRGKSDTPIPLSYAQERLWFLDQMGLVGAAYNMPLALRLSGELDEGALEKGFAELVCRHEVLRTRFGVHDGVPYQLIDPPGPFYLHRSPLSDIADHRQREQQLSEFMRLERLHRFDLSQGPLIRVVLVSLSKLDYALLVTMHHIVSDGWSIGVIIREICTLYGAYACGRPSPLPALEVQYADYAIWQRHWLQGDTLKSQLRYWSERLEGAPPQLQLQTDRPRTAVGSFKGRTVRFNLPAALTGALEELARREGATLFMVFLAAYQLLLSRWSGQRDIVVGSPIAGRANREIEGLVGFFVNTLALRTDLAGNPRFRHLIERVKQTTLGAYAHQDIPFEKLVKEFCPERDLTLHPIFQVMLALQNFPEEQLQLAGCRGTWVTADHHTAKFDLSLYLFEGTGGLSGLFEYAEDLFEQGTIERMAGHLRMLLENIVADPDCQIDHLPLFSEAERQQLLEEFNATGAAYPQDRCIHDLFTEQVDRTPDAPALIFDEYTLSYAELNQRANQLAHCLIGKGVGPDKLVGICLERKPEMVVGLLGILKAGGAYVPLDPNYPLDRLGQILEDAAPRLLVTQEQLRDKFADGDAELVVLDAVWRELAQQPSVNPDPTKVGVYPHHLAYVIYTSGSTGRPKGVAIEHRNAANLIRWARSATTQEEFSQTLQSTSLNFDLSVYECFVPLATGGSIRVVQSALTLAKQAIAVTLINTVPSAIKAILESGNISPATRVVNLAGEILTKDVVDRIFACSQVERVCNLYGPSETTTYSTFLSMTRKEGFIPSIGRPISNTQIYILDGRCQVVPIGVVGEIFIGGAGVARGYLNQPELTSERFVPDPFSADQQGRLYRTGDLGRWRPDGTIEYLGRNDHQVKIRGHRIELGEIEARLLQHQQVKEAVVIAREDVPGNKRLVAYVVGARHVNLESDSGATPENLRENIVGSWRTIWKETYATQDQATGPSFTGWNSSYTGQAIPESQMQEWLMCTVERIKALRPRNVLEIGCGVGLLLQHIAPRCSVYVGADFSSAAVEQLRQWVIGRDDLKHVQLLQRSATEFQDLESGSFDTVMLNSVVQYFPDIEYLRTVLQESARLISPGGKIFIGDVRHLGLLPMFHSAVQLEKAAATVGVRLLRNRIDRAVAQERELVIDPQFFRSLPGRLPGIAAAEVHLKRGQSVNELTRYRYDVTLQVGEQIGASSVYEPLEWRTTVGSLVELERGLRQRRWHAARLTKVPNQRLVGEAAAQKLIEMSDERLTAGTLRLQLSELPLEDVDPEKIWELAETHEYDVVVSPGEQGCFDVQLSDRAKRNDVPREVRVQNQVNPWSGYANDPMESDFKQQLVPRLREYLRGLLPEYMVPSAWMILKELPLTPNGKVNRRALLSWEVGEHSSGKFDPPQGEVEEALAKIWEDLLQVDRVGRQDNFFELGGHSLLALKALFTTNQRFGSAVTATDVYQSPTIRELAVRIRGGRPAETRVDLAREADFDEGIAGEHGQPRIPPNAVLLTGCTGFVGRFLAAQLLQDTDATVYCLVRAASTQHALSRVKTTLSKWNLWREEFEHRIVPIPGDLSVPRLGITESTYEDLCRNIDSIYHCGTSMNHLETYTMARPANVEGSKELLRLAARHTPKVINYISSVGVFSMDGAATARIVDERSPIDFEKHWTSQGYTASKWVGEKIFMLASERGIRCNIFRLGLVWADTQRGRYDELQWGYKVIKNCLLSGYGIKDYSYEMAPTPVDYVARAVIFLGNRNNGGRGIFHITSSKQLIEGVFERCNEIAGTSLHLLPFSEWMREIKRLHHEESVLPEVPLIEFAFAKDEMPLDEGQLTTKSPNIRFNCARTHRELERAGIVAPVADNNLLRTCLDSMLSRDVELRQLIDPGRLEVIRRMISR